MLIFKVHLNMHYHRNKIDSLAPEKIKRMQRAIRTPKICFTVLPCPRVRIA